MLSDHIKQDIFLAFQTGGCLLLYESSAESSCSFLRYFHSAISNHLTEKRKICLVVYGRLTQVSVYCILFLGLGTSSRGRSPADRETSYSHQEHLTCPLRPCSRTGQYYLSHVTRKPVFRVFYQVQHKAGCTTTEDG